MLTIILSILKTIGIILLGIITAILIFLLLVLIWPYFYKIKVCNNETFSGKILVSWFFHILIIEAIYNEVFNVRVRLFGIPIYDRNKKSAKEEKRENQKDSKKEKRKSSRDLKTDEDSYEVIDTKEPNEMKELQSIDNLEVKEEKEEINNSNTNKKESKLQKLINKIKSIVNRIIDFLMALPEKIEHLNDNLEERISGLIETIDYYENLFSKKGTRWVIDYVKKEVILLVKHLKPRYSKINIRYGNDDPAAVAKVIEYYGMASPWLPKHTTLDTTFEENCFIVDGIAKGSFFLIYLIIHAGKLLLNKKVKKFMKLLKREEA